MALAGVVALVALLGYGEAVYDSSYVYVRSRSEQSGKELRRCANFQQFQSQHLPTTIDDAEELFVNRLARPDGRFTLSICNGSWTPHASAVLVSSYRLLRNTAADCPPSSVNLSDEFDWQVNRSLTATDGAHALLFVVKRGQEYLKYNNKPIKDLLFSEFRDGMLTGQVDTHIFFAYESVYDELLELGPDVRLAFYRPASIGFDFAMVVVWIIAVGCVTVGGAWSGKVRYDLAQEEAERAAASDAVASAAAAALSADEETPSQQQKEAPPSPPKSPEPSAAPFSYLSIAFFVCIIVGMLLLLYFFYQYFVWFIIVTYTMAGAMGMYECLSAAMGACCGDGCGAKVGRSLSELTMALLGSEKECPMRCARRHPKWRNLVLFLCCAAFCMTWCVCRNHPYAFLAQDTISVFFSINLIRLSPTAQSQVDCHPSSRPPRLRPVHGLRHTRPDEERM